jgi:hypothetical protein
VRYRIAEKKAAEEVSDPMRPFHAVEGHGVLLKGVG